MRILVTWRQDLLHLLERRIVRSGGKSRLRELLAEVVEYSGDGVPSEIPVDPAVLLELVHERRHSLTIQRVQPN